MKTNNYYTTSTTITSSDEGEGNYEDLTLSEAYDSLSNAYDSLSDANDCFSVGIF